jgi:hypothetical protein
MEKKIIYQDKVYEQSIKTSLERTKEKFQKVLDAYKAMDLETQFSIYGLVWEPEQCFRAAIEDKKFQGDKLPPAEKKKYLERLTLPVPNNYYVAAKNAQQDPYSTESLMLFANDNGSIRLTLEADNLINSKRVYAETKEQEALAGNLQKIADLLNDCNSRTGGRVLGQDFQQSAEQWGSIFLTSYRGDNRVFLDPEKLREFLSMV